MAKVTVNCFICPEEIQDDDLCVPIRGRGERILAIAHSECFDALKYAVSEDCMLDPVVADSGCGVRTMKGAALKRLL